jgi:hypothetical protein
LHVAPAKSGWTPGHARLERVEGVVAFFVSDTGIGIPHDKKESVFEAFQQLDQGSSRQYGGAGLGLPICRELTRLLGGELQVRSNPGEGSTFVLYLPLSDNPALQPEPNIGPEARARSVANAR